MTTNDEKQKTAWIGTHVCTITPNFLMMAQVFIAFAAGACMIAKLVNLAAFPMRRRGFSMKTYTIGYGGRKPEGFLQTLQTAGVRAVVDVRLRPDRASLGAYSLARSPEKGIQRLLFSAGIEYYSHVELGNPFYRYDDWPRRYQTYFPLVADLVTECLTDIAQPYCLMCAERSPSQCHRLQIADYLASQGFDIEHL